jgi:hypothetical protein
MKPLDKELQTVCESVAQSYPHTDITFVYDPEVRTNIARAVSVNERVLLTYKPLHDMFFKDVRWSDAEEKEIRTGLHIDTLELAFPQKKMFSMLKSWRFAQLMTMVGLPKIVAKDNAKRYESGAAIGCITVSKTDKEAFIEAGTCMQHLWLLTTKYGLAFQPITAIAYLGEQVSGGTISFPENIKNDILSAIDTVRTCARIKDTDTIALIFRFGYTDTAPSAITSRRSPYYL